MNEALVVSDRRDCSGTGAVSQERGPVVIGGTVSNELCRRLIHRLGAEPYRPRSYQGVVDDTLRRCDFVPVSLDEIGGDLAAVVSPIIEASLAVVTRKLQDQPAMLYRYPPGVGFVAHHDEVTIQEIERGRSNGQPILFGDITVVVGLNPSASYEGGELFFDEPRLEVKLDQGTVVAFPATRRFIHGVRPVRRGDRFSLVFRLDIEAPR